MLCFWHCHELTDKTTLVMLLCRFQHFFQIYNYTNSTYGSHHSPVAKLGFYREKKIQNGLSILLMP